MRREPLEPSISFSRHGTSTGISMSAMTIVDPQIPGTVTGTGTGTARKPSSCRKYCELFAVALLVIGLSLSVCSAAGFYYDWNIAGDRTTARIMDEKELLLLKGQISFLSQAVKEMHLRVEQIRDGPINGSQSSTLENFTEHVTTKTETEMDTGITAATAADNRTTKLENQVNFLKQALEEMAHELYFLHEIVSQNNISILNNKQQDIVQSRLSRQEMTSLQNRVISLNSTVTQVTSNLESLDFQNEEMKREMETNMDLLNRTLRFEAEQLKSKIEVNFEFVNESIRLQSEEISSQVHQNLNYVHETIESAVGTLNKDIEILQNKTVTLRLASEKMGGKLETGLNQVNETLHSVVGTIWTDIDSLKNNTDNLGLESMGIALEMERSLSHVNDTMLSEISTIHRDIDAVKNDTGSLRLESAQINRAMGDNFNRLNDTVRSAVSNMNIQINQLSNNADNFSATLNSFKTGIQSVFNGCGGLIPIPALHATTSFEHTTQLEFNPHERCLWTFENTNHGARRKVTLRIKVITSGFTNSAGGLYALKWNRDSYLTTQKLLSQTQYEIVADGLFLSYNADGLFTGTSFTVYITATAAVASNIGSNWVYTSSSGSKAIGTYSDNELVTIAVTSHQVKTLTLNFLASEANHDRLTIYEIKRAASPTEHARLHGSITSPRNIVTTAFPILVIFSTDGSVTGPGFQITWQ